MFDNLLNTFFLNGCGTAVWFFAREKVWRNKVSVPRNKSLMNLAKRFGERVVGAGLLLNIVT
jgi:hypothetical protein